MLSRDRTRYKSVERFACQPVGATGCDANEPRVIDAEMGSQ